MDAREQTMGDDDKELTEDEQKSLFPADFLDGLGRAECEPDAEPTSGPGSRPGP